MTFRLIAIGVVLALCAGAVWKVNDWREDAARLPLVEAERDAERKQRKAEQQAAAEAARESAEAHAREAALAARIAAIPPARLIYVPKPIPGEPAPAGGCARLSDDFLRAYNEAVTGRPAR